MTSQPEALRLAQALESQTTLIDYDRKKAAAELRRLHEANQIMFEALNNIAAWRDGAVAGGWFDEPGSAQTARDAIAKVTGD